MTRYIFDSGFFVVIREYFPETFPSFWREMDELVRSGEVSSVDEAFDEIEQYGGAQEHLIQWMKRNRKIFTKPSLEEQQKITEIFSIQKFRELISGKKQLQGNPCADPFIIAKAMITRGTVVTKELPAKRDKRGNIQGKHRIPDVCTHFNIPCMTPQQFMQAQKWSF